MSSLASTKSGPTAEFMASLIRWEPIPGGSRVLNRICNILGAENSGRLCGISRECSGSPVMDEKGQVIGVAALENKQGQNVNHVLVRFSIPFASRGIYPTGSSSISAKGPGTGTNSAIRGAHGHAYFKRTDADPDKLVTYAERIGNGAIFKRLGSLTERAKDLKC